MKWICVERVYVTFIKECPVKCSVGQMVQSRVETQCVRTKTATLFEVWNYFNQFPRY